MARTLALISAAFLVACGGGLPDAAEPTLDTVHVNCEEDRQTVQAIVIQAKVDPTVSGLFAATEWASSFVKSYEVGDTDICTKIKPSTTDVYLNFRDRADRFMYRMTFDSIVDLTQTKLDRHPVNGISDFQLASDFRPLLYCAASYSTSANPEFLVTVFKNKAVVETGAWADCYQIR